MAAVAAALDDGVDGVEVDVRLTADGVLGCSHDADLARLGGTPLVVARSTARDLRRLPLGGGHPTATLAEVLAATRARGRRRVVVEAKPTGDEELSVRTAEALAGLLTGAAGGLDVTVSSFDPVLLGLLRAELIGTQVRSALVGNPSARITTVLRGVLDGGHDELHAHLSSLRADPDAVFVARRLGVSVTCWTVNRRADAALMRLLGVEAVITDRPWVVFEPVTAGRRG